LFLPRLLPCCAVSVGEAPRTLLAVCFPLWVPQSQLAAVRNWYDANEADQHVQANIERLVRLHPNGLVPYIVGMPVIG
jgi:hypothetical protein